MTPLLIPTIIEAGIKVIDKIFPDPNEAAKAKVELFKLQQNGELAVMAQETDIATAQAKINEIEAASSDKFKSWWRPAIGWVCVSGLAYQLLLRPLVIVFFMVMGHANLDFSILSLDLDTLATILFGMLGLGWYRTKEKLNGVS